MARQHRDYGVSIRIPLTEEVHRALRIAAAQNSVSRGYAVAKMVEDWLRRHGDLPEDKASSAADPTA
jgi:hypothetical protein